PWTGSAEIGPAFHPSAHRRQQPSQGHLRKLQPFWEATRHLQQYLRIPVTRGAIRRGILLYEKAQRKERARP
ncbi:uncharacterized protein QC764_0113810, partial [Podospora pseudoanserina]